MTSATNNSEIAELARAVESLRREVAGLKDRTQALETALIRRVHEQVPLPRESGQAAGLSEELVMVISAAIAAYLGVKPRIRQIVLVQSHPWSQQGRVTIQASHTLAVHHS
jgi:methylmalonyl-CoA carboxyltransferase large subunit